MDTSPLNNREILLCLTGGIACYKSADLASRLVRAGARVSVAMTESATKFIAPLTFQSLTHRPVHVGLWEAGENYNIQHIALGGQADLMIVAPATANIIAKIACGIADDLVSTLALSSASSCPLLVAPAMNSAMLAAPATQDNLATLRRRGVHLVGPESGRLACGVEGAGRMSEPQQILEASLSALLPA